MKKILVISLAGLALVLAGCSLNTPNANQNVNQTQPIGAQNQNVDSPAVENNTADSANIIKQQTSIPPATTVTTPAPVPQIATSDYLWSVFDQYNNKLKNANYNDYVASEPPSSVLMSPTQFAQLSAFTYNENMKLNKADFVNKWQDDKQAIFSTNPVRTETADSNGYTQTKISFIKDNGAWKILLISPSNSWSVLKSTGASGEKDLQAMISDSDKDGLTNWEETCSGANHYNTSCVKTDPNKRDTNGNGWWDGIEIDMK
jgi:hypothetical protein